MEHAQDALDPKRSCGGTDIPVQGYVTGITAQQRLLGRLSLQPLSFGHLFWNEKQLPIRPTTRWQNRWRDPWEWKGSLEAEDVTVTLTLPWHEMVLAEYDDLAGHQLYCHHTDRADCFVIFRTPQPPPRVFCLTGMAHLEIGSWDIDPRVTHRVMQL